MLDLLTSSYAQVLQAARRSRAGSRPYRIVILTDSTMSPIEPYLTILGAQIRLEVSLTYADPATTVPASFVAGNGSDQLKHADCILVLLSLPVQAPDLHHRAAFLPSQTRDELEEHVRNTATLLLSALRRQSAAPILWFSFEDATAALMTVTMPERPAARLNRFLETQLAGTKDTHLLDFSSCLTRVGQDNAFDRQRARTVSVLYRPALFREIALESFKYIRVFTGNTKKCLVLDCDGTLWGGTVGEDGVDNLAIGQEGSRSPYLAIQRAALDLHDNGILLALCSKNDASDVWQVFDQRPDMILQKNHFAAHRINWEDKPANLRSLAEQLNIALDSIVFVDDSAFETSMVEELVPDVTCLSLDQATLLDFRGTLSRLGWFASPATTKEDRLRAQSYRDDRQRGILQGASATLEEYLRSLSMQVAIVANSEVDIDRAAQLCRRTNQFNLTLHRHGADEIAGFVADADADVFMLSVSDKVGDLGNVGLAILRYRHDQAVIDTFLLSCRAFGRGLEDALLACCVDKARHRDAARLVGRYVAGPRNNLVCGFYKDRNFAPHPDGDTFALSPLAFAPPDHYASITMPDRLAREPICAGTT